jgi:2-polyprenyl-3-methyl-5-hydroxy-6-metoxy-1,4-benzoquinol methylase
LDTFKWQTYQLYQGSLNDGTAILPKEDIGNTDQHKLSIEYAESFLDKEGKTLIIGCGGGSELKCLVEKGFKHLIGIDNKAENIKAAKEHFGYKILKMDAHEMQFNKNTFDTIIHKHVFEHSTSPFIFFMECWRVLKKHGEMYIQMPVDDRDPFKIDHEFDAYKHMTGLHHIMLLYPFQVVNLGYHTGFKLVDFNSKVGGSWNFIFSKLSEDELSEVSHIPGVKKVLEDRGYWK